MPISADQLQMHGLDPLAGKRFLVRKRDGRIEEFNEARIVLAMESAFKAHHGFGPNQKLPGEQLQAIKLCADRVVERTLARAVRGEGLEVERIQDAVEDQLMQAGHFDVARRYILYREQRRQARAEREGRGRSWPGAAPAVPVPPPGPAKLRELYSQTFVKPRAGETLGDLTFRYFESNLNEGEYFKLLAPSMLEFDAALLARQLRPDRDTHFGPEGLAALQKGYLKKAEGRLLETPQYFWMRVAMGLALNESELEARAVQFYETLSTFRLVPSEPILLHAGAVKPDFCEPAPPLDGWKGVWEGDLFDCLEDGISRPKGIWLPDLFLNRLRGGGNWPLFGAEASAALRAFPEGDFQKRFEALEQTPAACRTLPASKLWTKIAAAANGRLTLAFKDRLAQRAVRVGASCPAGAINLAAHISPNGSEIDLPLLRQTIATAVRMFDNAVELGSVTAGRVRRPIALSVIGLPEVMARINAESLPGGAPQWAGEIMELVAWQATRASVELAVERGGFDGRLDLAFQGGRQDWPHLQSLISRHGIRNASVTGAVSGDRAAHLAGVSASGVPPLADCVAQLQKWTELAWPLDLPAADYTPARLQKSCLEAWDKGVLLIETSEAGIAVVPAKKTAPREMAAAH